MIYLSFAAGLVLLILGADVLVRGASRLRPRPARGPIAGAAARKQAKVSYCARGKRLLFGFIHQKSQFVGEDGEDKHLSHN